MIDSAAGLRDFSEELSSAAWLGIDTEFLRERTYYPRLCLMQVAAGETIACVDPVEGLDFEPLLNVMFRPDVVKVMHSARQDLEFFYSWRQQLPAPLFDTQVAGALCGLGDQTGYASLVQTLLGVEVSKDQTRTNWCRRPLTEAQLAYARDDVRYLGALQEWLSGRLEQLGRLAWLEEDCRRLTDPALYLADPAMAWQRLSGARLSPREQVVLRAVAEWREQRAQDRDLPRQWVLPDRSLVALAQVQPDSVRALDAVGELGAQRGDAWKQELIGLISEAREQPEELVWDNPQALSRSEQALVKTLMSLLRARAEQLEVPASLLCNRRDVVRLVKGERELPVLAGWRRGEIGEALLADFQG
ncbi:MAG: ribonuclease D [Gammaproteobacteria bacterium]|nr:ribonuclease D [Gammaproteobacteria bacterium]